MCREVRNLPPSFPASGEVFTPKVIRRTGSSTSSRGSGWRVVGIGQGVADLYFGKATDDKEVTSHPFLDVDSAQSFEAQEDGEFAPERRLVGIGMAQRHLLARAQCPFHHPADRQTAQIIRRVEIGDQSLHRRIGVCRSGWGCDRGWCRAGEPGRRHRPGSPTPFTDNPLRAMVLTMGNSMCESSVLRSKKS